METPLPCPGCGASLPAPAAAGGGLREQWPDFPFCSSRCRLIDLGAWFDEAYRIPADPPPPDEPASDP